MDLESCVTGSEALRALFRTPSQRALNKEIDHIDDVATRFIAACPLTVLATSDGDKVDISPRGGEPGFVKVIDATHIAFGDLSGNNRIDSYRNLVTQPNVAMLFLVPGLDETMRVNGIARVSLDDEVRQACASGGVVPNLAIVVEVVTCFLHCGKAMRRSSVWEPSTWPSITERPSGAEMLQAHTGESTPVDELATLLESDYEATLWRSGGTG